MSTRPSRQAKKNAIANIKKCIAEMNTYDDNGILYDVKEVKQVTIEDVTKMYEASTLKHKFYALLPSICLEYLENSEDGIYILHDVMFKMNGIKKDWMADVYKWNEDLQDVVQKAVSFYDNYTDEAKQYVYDMSALFSYPDRLKKKEEKKDIVTLEDVMTLYNESKYIPEILALYPTHLRNDLLEDDVRIQWIEKILAGKIRDASSFKSTKKWEEYSMIVEYYKNHTQEAKEYILQCIEEMWADYY